ncbi:MAG: efflux RND transporter periplasmic adaptor subunit [Betaproteobacteria bacterium]|nr:efflux RND transporter periplasmic adaptor subunit [Betaproteobacteria bacterium]
MKSGIAALVGVVAVAAATGGYFFGNRQGATHSAAAPASSTSTGGDVKKERKLLYYRNPMGLPDTSPVPKKDSMGMDYIAVYEGEEPASSGSELKISTDRLQKLGVRTQAAELRAIDRIVKAAGRVEVDERLLATIAPKFEGYVERLHVNTTGQPVSKGQPLFEVYSPELVAAQREYAIAAQGKKSLKDAGAESRSGMAQLAESSLTRLRNWDVSEEQIEALEKSGEAKRTVTFRSPATGIVMEKKAVSGMRFMPGEMLYQVAELSRIWVLADVSEQDIGLVTSGRKAQVRINAYPDKWFEGVITYVYPTLKAETRTVPVRLELANPGGLLKPGMYAQVELSSGNAAKVVAVPVSAVIDSGVRKVVLVQPGEGRFEPREVQLGARSADWVEVKGGIAAGEIVVVSANFLIDAESNLRASLGGMGSVSKSADGTRALSHQAAGTVDALGPNETVTVSHEPIASLKWPAMTMDFAFANAALAGSVKPGTRIEFEFVERKPGEFVITSVKSASGAAKAKDSPAPADSHKGH